ncbi:MAG TPA: beta-N-acetylglucosaminidase [Bacteroidetes bacterium]|nr:beta-N-acetylglucosaminidase [Bacteroidota bacterium]
MSRGLFVLALVLAVVPCAGQRDAASAAHARNIWIESTLSRLTLEEKVGQLVFVWTSGEYQSQDSESWRELERLISKRKIGGFIFSVGDVYEYAVAINRLQERSPLPLLIAGDFEYGIGMRVRRSTTFPRAMAVGATRNPQYAYEIGKATALEGRALGVHQNYAPTIDVNNNPRNPVINTRSFGDDVKLVSKMGAAFVKGTHDGGMLATVKHFPGHGDSDVDTHLGLTTLDFGKARLDAVELAPYREAFEAGAVSVMVGHIAVPTIDTASGIPATVSHSITTKLLQDALNFSGLIVTDAMVMRGVASKYEPGESAVLAIMAGTDLVLMPVDADVAIDAIVSAVRRGEITEERIDHSVRKLLGIKQGFGLDKERSVNVARIAEVVNSREHQLLALKIAREAVTVLGNRNNILPLSKVGSGKILDIVISDTEDPTDGKTFHGLLRERVSGVEYAKLDPRSNRMEIDALVANASSADLIIVQLHLYVRSVEMTGFIQKEQKVFMNRLLALKKPVVAISFGNPYVITEFPSVDAYVCAYSDAEVMQRAAVEILFAEHSAKGRLPVAIRGVFKFGDGIAYPKQALGKGLPEEAGLNSKELAKVDDIVESAISDTAFPGAMLLVARNGIVVHNKAYGSFDYGTYSKRLEVNTMFDLASVTKVVATTSAVMRLVDEGKIDLDDRVIEHIPQFGQNGKEEITLYNLMVHNSGLPAWRKFYEFCSTPACVLDSVYASPLAYRTGNSFTYSDLGLITMGKVIEKASRATLDQYVDSVFFKPLGMSHTMYNPPQRFWNRIAPTEVDTIWRKSRTAVRGTVHDENAYVLGGVSGHAGLFSTASDLSVFLQMLLNGGTYGGKRYLSEDVIRRFTTRQSDKSTRGIGWDMKNPTRSWAGSILSEKTFLHTGFTGTSVAVDPERNLIIVFLTNRVHPTRAGSKIFDVRPQVHDAVAKAIKEAIGKNPK